VRRVEGLFRKESINGQSQLPQREVYANGTILSRLHWDRPAPSGGKKKKTYGGKGQVTIQKELEMGKLRGKKRVGFCVVGVFFWWGFFWATWNAISKAHRRGYSFQKKRTLPGKKKKLWKRKSAGSNLKGFTEKTRSIVPKWTGGRGLRTLTVGGGRPSKGGGLF